MNKIRLLFLLALVLPFHTEMKAQNLQDTLHHRIEVQIDYYPNDTLIMGYFYGKGQFAKDTALKQNGRQFVFQGKDTLPRGMYFVLTRPNSNYVQFVVGADQFMKIRTNYLAMNDSLRIEGSEENKILKTYTDFLDEKSPIARSLKERIGSGLITEPEKDSLQDVLSGIDKEVKDFQNDILKQYPKSFTAALIRINREPEVPEFKAEGDSLKLLRFEYYKKHYFDNVDFEDERLLYSPFLFPKINTYIENLTIQLPDSVNHALDFVLHKFKPGSELFKYFLPYYLNHYATSKYVGMDGVFVHLVKEYYAKGMAPWMKEENLKKLIAEADKLEPILIGKPAPDITVFDRKGKPVHLYDLKAGYTILVFWAPDCGHCKKAMPKLAKWYEKHAQDPDSIKVLSICTKLLDKEKGCWEMVDEKKLGNLMNCSDKYLKSKFSIKYNVHTTPSIFVLDRNKKIMINKIGVEQLDGVLEKLRELERENAKE